MLKILAIIYINTLRRWMTWWTNKKIRAGITPSELYDLDQKIADLKKKIKTTADVMYELRKFRWVSDPLMGLWDYSPDIYTFLHNSYKDDCIAGYEKVYTTKGPKEIKDLKIGDEVLSYNFKTQIQEYKKITNFWNKGKLQTNRVHFRNGTHTDFSSDHKLFTKNIKDLNYIPTKIKDINLDIWHKRKIATLSKVEYTPKDISWLNEDLCFVIGHFFAEGWKTKKKNLFKPDYIRVFTCGYDIYECIIPKLEKHNIPFREFKNNTGIPCLEFKNSELKSYLITLKENSFEFNINNELRNLPVNKLQKLLDGHLLGDGWTYNELTSKRLKNSNRKKEYSTSSKNLADFICEISLKIGIPLYKYLQLKHGGLGKKPIYRIDENTNSHFAKNYGYDTLSEVGISYIEKLGKTEMFDFEVEDNHNFFVYESNVLTHNCDGAAFYTKYLFDIVGDRDCKIISLLSVKPFLTKSHVICIVTDLNKKVYIYSNGIRYAQFFNTLEECVAFYKQYNESDTLKYSDFYVEINY